MSNTNVTLYNSQPVRLTGKVTAPARLLMCAPSAYDLRYVINPWMSLTNSPDPISGPDAVGFVISNTDCRNRR